MPVDDVLTPIKPEEAPPVEYETVEIQMEDHVLINLALRAHELDITLNQYMNDLIADRLKAEVEESEKQGIIFNMEK